MEWLGRVLRKDSERTANKLLGGTQRGGRKKGRPGLTLRLLMSYIYIYIYMYTYIYIYTYGAPILDVSRSHTTTQHSK